MKKILSLLMALCLVLALCACGDSGTETKTSENDTQQTTEPSPAETPEETDAPSEEPAKVYHIGICQLVQHEALDAATLGFREKLTELLGEENVEFDEQNAQNDIPTCSTIVNQFVADNADLILANATPALQAAASATGTIPILGTSITDYATALSMDNFSGSTGVNISGTSDLAPLSEQADMLLELFPEAKNVGILFCSSEPNSFYQADVITEYLTGKGVTCTNYTFSDSNDVASVAQSACDSSDVIFIPTDNTAANNTELIRNVVIPTGTPIIAGEEGICRGCGVATLSISYYDIGAAAGEMAYEILVNGADVSTMQIGYAPQVTKKYNAEICEELNIAIPEGYEAIE